MYAKTWNSTNSNIEQTYKSIARDILTNGLTSKPRGKQTKQCIGATIIMNPKDTMIRNVARKMNYVFMLVQKLIYTSGNGLYAGVLDWYNSNYSYYEDGIDIGNYCWRIMPQLRRTINLLKQDPDTRQAVISIYNNLFDQRPTKDTPCTLSLQFLIRNNKLDMIVTMRSNDLLWGFSYDINQFAFIQKLIAMFLRIDTGTYIHHSNSLHIYDYSYKQFQQIIQCDQYFEDQQDKIPQYKDNFDLNKDLNNYFEDLQKFWKLQSAIRFNKNFIKDSNLIIGFYQNNGFFNYRLEKLSKYNSNKIKDNSHMWKYFKV